MLSCYPQRQLYSQHQRSWFVYNVNFTSFPAFCILLIDYDCEQNGATELVRSCCELLTWFWFYNCNVSSTITLSSCFFPRYHDQEDDVGIGPCSRTLTAKIYLNDDWKILFFIGSPKLNYLFWRHPKRK